MNTLAILLLLSSAAASANTKRIARAHAQEMADAFVQGNFGRVADFTHPRLIQGMGGRGRMIEVFGAAASSSFPSLVRGSRSRSTRRRCWFPTLRTTRGRSRTLRQQSSPSNARIGTWLKVCMPRARYRHKQAGGVRPLAWVC